jgi:CO/xanthine dehydrogenase FAD-binding subunit
LTAIALPSHRTLRLFLDRSLRPIVSVAIGLDIAEGVIAGGRVAVGCAYAAPMAAKLPLAEPLHPADLAEHAALLAVAVSGGLPEPTSDHHAGGAYRRRMVGVLVRRCLAGLP